jgi:hypothetical protein
MTEAKTNRNHKDSVLRVFSAKKATFWSYIAQLAAKAIQKAQK